MYHGFIKVAAGTPDIKVADVEYNSSKIAEIMEKANKQKVKLLVLPELCITGYTCCDLFYQKKLLNEVEKAIEKIAETSEKLDLITVVGAPIKKDNTLYNSAVVIYKGDILGVVPKSEISDYESRYFDKAGYESNTIEINRKEYVFGTRTLFVCDELPEFSFATEIGEDLCTPVTISSEHAVSGATIIANLSASNQTIGKSEYRRMLVETQSVKCLCGYIYANAGEGESTTDLVFTAHNMIVENGELLEEDNSFSNNLIISEIDVEKLTAERRKSNLFKNYEEGNYNKIYFNMPITETKISRRIGKMPFIPSSLEERKKVCNEVLNIQALGLKKRIAHSKCEKVVIGISGGLDSCLATIVAVKAMELLDRPHSDVLTVTMPCFGTSERTHNNAIKLAECLGATLKEIDISKTVLSHFEDIEQKEDCYDVTFENAQARERTQVLMDIANQQRGMVVGTGDLSELSLGWATYNGDHMSMYGVNASVPKTLIRYIISNYANDSKNTILKEILSDIVDTPVSPELLPSKALEQKTEDIVGPYELHDFFLYYIVRWGFEPEKVLRIAEYTFSGDYDIKEITNWLKTFYKRFFASQFKRSCLPDGPKVGTVSLSPRGDFRMPSDASVNIWLKSIEK